MRLRDQLAFASLVNLAKQATPREPISADLRACKEVSRCTWFFKWLVDSDLAGWEDGLRAVQLLERVSLEASKDDEGVTHMLADTID